jgi:hypothetical protein
MLITTELWQQALDEGYNTDIAYMDYQKAFDTVSSQKSNPLESKERSGAGSKASSQTAHRQ